MEQPNGALSVFASASIKYTDCNWSDLLIFISVEMQRVNS